MSEKGKEAQRFMQTGGFNAEGRGAPEAEIKPRREITLLGRRIKSIDRIEIRGDTVAFYYYEEPDPRDKMPEVPSYLGIRRESLLTREVISGMSAGELLLLIRETRPEEEIALIRKLAELTDERWGKAKNKQP